MAVNKNYLARLQAIHERLSTGLHYSKDELLDAIEAKTDARPSDKTLYNDLRALKDEYDAPILEGDRSGKPYYYTKSFSLFGVLNPTDASLANEAVALIRKMNTLPQFAGLDDVLLKFEQQPGVIGKPQKSVVHFEQNLGYSGLKWLSTIYHAIQENRQVRVVYTHFNKPPIKLDFSPYLLKEFNNRWHMYGYGAESEGLNSLALDRIDSLKISDLLRRPDTTNWEEFLANVIGFTHYANMPLETWQLRVWLPRAYYLETKPLHNSQKIISKTDTYWDFQYQLQWNRELDSAILQLGADVEVLTPEKRRKALARTVRNMMERYRDEAL